MIDQDERRAVSLMSRLRDATAEAHQRTEASFGFSHIQNGTLTAGIFSALLHRLQALYVPAERAILAFLARTSTPYIYQTKALYLAQDLAAIGCPAPLRERALACDDLEHGLALLYVLEGATLGGKIISAHVHRQLGELGQGATRFFDPYGTSLGPRWHATRRLIEDVAARYRLDESTILQRAVQVFTWFGAGLDGDP